MNPKKHEAIKRTEAQERFLDDPEIQEALARFWVETEDECYKRCFVEVEKQKEGYSDKGVQQAP